MSEPQPGRPLRVGVAGIGMIARKMHLPNLATMPEVEVVAMWSRRQESLESGLAALGGGHAALYQEFERFLAHDGLDAVLISAPDHLHEEMAVAALAAGKHVYLEKPPAITEEGNRRVLATAEASGLITMIGLQNRYSALYMRAADLLSDGAIGPLRMLWCKEYRVPFLPKPGDWILTKEGTGGSLLVKCIHFFDVFNWFAGALAARVMALGGNGVVPGQETLDHAWVLVEHANGVRACLGMVLFAPQGERVDLELIGERGRIALNVEDQTLTVETPAGIEVQPTSQAGERFHPGSRPALEDFLRCARDGEAPRSTVRVGVEAALLALAAERSVEERRAVELAPLAAIA